MKTSFNTSGDAPARHNPSQNPPDPVVVRYAEAYLRMAAEAKYRPKAPGDGCGGIYLSAEELSDQLRLQREALEYGFARCHLARLDFFLRAEVRFVGFAPGPV